MPTDQVLDLLMRWEGSAERGEELTPEELCRDHPELLVEMRECIAAIQQVPRVAGESTASHVPNPLRNHTHAPCTGESPGEQIGPYKLRQQLGEGGMGTVWAAEQLEPVRRQVALKLIKAGMDSRAVLARFEAERQALALMDHPNIAKVLDAGTTVTGRPFFVMELVKAIPITRYCDDEKLSPRERLELFIPVCHAVQHAHKKGIIHRDLKPSNVLVGLYDGKPIPKVIDFGIAKATGSKLTAHTVYTEVGSLMGTLEYMAPEQAEVNNLDIDTRADIYALGVILYELLTGSPPFSRKRLQGEAFTEMLRLIREVEPSKPSTKLSQSNELRSLAAVRKLEPTRLASLMRGDLDWIVMKCLEKERGRRYETAHQLAMEIERYLADEPVMAGPPSAVYRLQKFVRRHRTAVTSAAACLLLLIGATIFSSMMYSQAEKERAVAVKERGVAVAAAEEAKMVRTFFQDGIIKAAQPENQAGGLGRNVTVRQAVDAVEPKIAKQFQAQPLVEAAVRHTLGTSYQLLGENDKASRQLERALELRKQHLGETHEDTRRTENNLEVARDRGGELPGNVAKSKKNFDDAVADKGPNDRETLAMQSRYASDLRDAKQLDQAMEMFVDIRNRLTEKYGANHEDVLTALNNIATTSFHQGKRDVALTQLEEVLAKRKQVLKPAHPDTLLTLNNVATMYSHGQRFEESVRLFEEALWMRMRIIGPKHPDTNQTIQNLGQTVEVLDGMDRKAAIAKTIPSAEAALRRCLVVLPKKMPDHWLIFETQSLLGWVLLDAGKEQFAEAETMLTKGYEGLKNGADKIPATERPGRLADAADRLADLYKKWSKPDDEKKWRETAKSYQPKA